VGESDVWVHNFPKGKLTKGETAEIEEIANKHNTVVDVVGSRAAGKSRNVDTDLPVGKGKNKRSDIDFRIDTNHSDVNDPISDLKKVGNGVGSASKKLKLIIVQPNHLLYE